MALISAHDDFTLYGSTPVENLFLMEFMPGAPGDCVRVYLYSLLLAQHPDLCRTVQDLARVLGMTVDDVLSALRYWEQKGLLTGLSDEPLSFRLNNVRSAMMTAKSEDDGAYSYSAFNERLQQIFGLLHPQQFRMAIEWVEDLKLSQEVVLYMAEQTNEILKAKNGGRQRSVPYAFKVLNQTALNWARDGITTLEAAQKEIQKELPPAQLAKKVLEGLGFRRNATSAEIDLAARWLNEWNYTQEDVLSALPETTSAANPSFHYLDQVLKNHRTRKFGTSLALELEQSSREWEAAGAVLSALGSASRVTDELAAAYRGFLAKGFAPETVLYAAAYCARHGRHTFQSLSDLLEKWLSLGLTTSERVEQYLADYAALRPLTVEVLRIIGQDRPATEADLDQMREWLELVPDQDVIRYAAQRAKGLQLPQRSITKRLEEFQQAGISTLDAAKAFQRPGQNRGGKRPAPGGGQPNPALGYTQRQYGTQDLNQLILNMDQQQEE